MLKIPPGGLELKTRIFVEVKASNLTNRYFTLLTTESLRNIACIIFIVFISA